MYHIRRSDTLDERSLHAQTEMGLRAAQAEAIIRTNYTGYAHEVFCDQDDMVASVHVPWDGVGDAASAGDAPGLVDYTHETDEVVRQAVLAQANGSDWFLMSIIGIFVLAIALRMSL